LTASARSSLWSDTASRWLVGGIAAVLLVVPVLNLLVPADAALHLSSYWVSLLGKYLCLALLALALDLVWGYAGILSLGHGAFFALGGYAMGMYLMRQIGERGVYGHPVLPDFMVFLNWPELPWYWYGFDSFAFAALMVVLVPGALAFAFGWFAFRSRVTGVYLSIITQALTYALMLAFFRNDMGFGGNNGLTDFKDLLGFSLAANGTKNALFVCSGLALIGGYLLCRHTGHEHRRCAPLTSRLQRSMDIGSRASGGNPDHHIQIGDVTMGDRLGSIGCPVFQVF